MAIKSVREINYFQTLRDREIGVSFKESTHFINYLVKIAEEDINKNQSNPLIHMERECIANLLSKLEENSSKEADELKLTFIESVYLHNILEHFENNYDKFKEYTKNKSIPHQLTMFVLAPASYYNTIFSIKDKLEHKLGELVTHSYKFKYKP